MITLLIFPQLIANSSFSIETEFQTIRKGKEIVVLLFDSKTDFIIYRVHDCYDKLALALVRSMVIAVN